MKLPSLDYSCVILCGGKSSRMKEDKALLPFSKSPSLSEYQYKRLKPYFKNIYISSKINKFDFLEQTSSIIYDEEKDLASPIIALNSIFKQIDEEKIFIITVDTPFVTIDTIKEIINEASNVDICVAQTDKIHNLCGLFSSSLLKKTENMVLENIHKVGYLLKNSETKYIKFQNDDEFINLNNPEDYKKALKLIEKFQ